MALRGEAEKLFETKTTTKSDQQYSKKLKKAWFSDLALQCIWGNSPNFKSTSIPVGKIAFWSLTIELIASFILILIKGKFASDFVKYFRLSVIWAALLTPIWARLKES